MTTAKGITTICLALFLRVASNGVLGDFPEPIAIYMMCQCRNIYNS